MESFIFESKKVAQPPTYVGVLKWSFTTIQIHPPPHINVKPIKQRKDLRHQAPDAAPRIFSIVLTKCFPELGKGRKIKRVLKREGREDGEARELRIVFLFVYPDM